ncbi:MAG: hypothetical protein ABIJ65_00210 [Chloroflexota bacterium]
MFLKSNHKAGRLNSTALILAALSIVSVLTYILVSHLYFRIGFPLDDSWIFQTYARNLAASGKWAFLPGEVSGGSTSPLWTAILSAGYFFHIQNFIWTFGMEILVLWGIAYFVERTIRKLVVSYQQAFPWIGFLIVFEWHFTWAAASGMETLLFSGMVLLVLFSLIEDSPQYFKIGFLIGISIWIRPDALTLLGPAFMVGIMEKSFAKKRILNIWKIIIGFGGVFTLYLLFSLAVARTPWPTTFYAKQAEYEILTNSLFLERLGSLFIQLLVGVGSILLPGFILLFINSIQKRKWGHLASFLWILGMLLIYAWRLPVVYQHGRYVTPCMLVYISFSCNGIMDYFNKPHQGWRWVIEKTWKISIGLILIFFWGYGAVVFARDVAIIESEMVDSARWINKNLPEDAIIAAHDIGALGYFGNHKIVDLAGLISPEVIPFLRDEELLAEFMDSKNVNYLLTFQDWYPLLSEGLVEKFSTHGRFAPIMGGENMILYGWQD